MTLRGGVRSKWCGKEERSAWTGGEDRRREERERGVDGARAGGLALTSLRGASTELDMYLQYYLY